MKSVRFSTAVVLGVVSLLSATATAQSTPAGAPAARSSSADAAAATSLPSGYVIGIGDVLSITVWGDKNMTAESVIVRPDGKISVPLLNDIQAAGLTPDDLRSKVIDAAVRLVKEPDATVMVKEIHSRNVFIQGNVAKPSSYPLIGQMDVMQLISQAGGLLEFADKEKIVIIRNEGGQTRYFNFNWKDVLARKHPEQNIQLKPFDNVIVP